MPDPLTELTKDLEVLAKPGANAPEPLVKIVEGLMTELGKADYIGPVFTALTTAISAGFADVAEALKKIASELTKLETETGNAGQLTADEIQKALAGLQNALSTAATLIPGNKNFSTLAGPFLGVLSELLKELGSFAAATKALNDLAGQLETIGKAF